MFNNTPRLQHHSGYYQPNRYQTPHRNFNNYRTNSLDRQHDRQIDTQRANLYYGSTYYDKIVHNRGRWKPITIDSYEIGRQVGRGMYGKVFFGTAPNRTTKVAIKELSKKRDDNHNNNNGQNPNAKEVERIQIVAIREMKILKAMHHENIVSLLDVVCSSRKS